MPATHADVNQTRFQTVSDSRAAELATLTKPFDATAVNSQDGPLGLPRSLLQPNGNFHILVCPLFTKIASTLRHYNSLKKKKRGISAVFLVPLTKRFNSVRPSSIFRNWKIIRTYPAEGQETPQLAAFTDYVPSDGVDTVSFTIANTLTMAVPATVSGSPCEILLDSGASGTGFISRAYCKSQGIPIYSGTAITVSLGNSSQVAATERATVNLRLSKIKAKVECLVLDDIPGYPLLLGDPWLTTFKANMDYQRQSVTLMNGSKVVTLYASGSQMKPARKPRPMRRTPSVTAMRAILPATNGTDQFVANGDFPSLISAKRFAKYLSKGRIQDVYVFMIKQIKEQVSDKAPVQPILEGDDPFRAYVPGDTLPERKMRILLQEYKDLYLQGLPDYEQLTHTKSVVPLVPDAKVPVRPMRRYSPAEVEEMRQQVEQLLAHGLIQKSSSPFGANILFAKKKDGGLRMCIDYRGLNKVTIPNRFPLPRIDDLVDRLQGAKVFTALDMIAAHHKIKLPEEEVPRTRHFGPHLVSMNSK